MRQPAPAFQTLEITEQYKEAVANLQQATRKQVAARATLLFENPAHPSLKAHSIKPDKHYWEAYANRGDRIIYIPEGPHLVLVDVVAHDNISRYSKRPTKRRRSKPPAGRNLLSVIARADAAARSAYAARTVAGRRWFSAMEQATRTRK